MVADRSSLEQFLLRAEKQLLFHGGGIPGVRQFRPALNETFGRGLYLTSDRERAHSYALFRTQTEYGGECDVEDIPPEGFQPTCYAFETDETHFLDLRTEEAMKAVLPFWRKYLVDNRGEILESSRRYFKPALVEVMVSCVLADMDRVLRWKFERITRYAFLEPQSYLNEILSTYLQSNGFDGIIAIEGNDRTGTKETKKGDSWVVFDPMRARLVEEYKVASVGE